jgi:hypothetical protein
VTDLLITALIVILIIGAKIIGIATAPWWFIVVASILLVTGSLLHSGILKIEVEKIK